MCIYQDQNYDKDTKGLVACTVPQSIIRLWSDWCCGGEEDPPYYTMLGLEEAVGG